MTHLLLQTNNDDADLFITCDDSRRPKRRRMKPKWGVCCQILQEYKDAVSCLWHGSNKKEFAKTSEIRKMFERARDEPTERRPASFKIPIRARQSTPSSSVRAVTESAASSRRNSSPPPGREQEALLDLPQSLTPAQVPPSYVSSTNMGSRRKGALSVL